MPDNEKKGQQRLMSKTTWEGKNILPNTGKDYELKVRWTKTDGGSNDSIPVKNNAIDKIKNLEPGSTINNK